MLWQGLEAMYLKHPPHPLFEKVPVLIEYSLKIGSLLRNPMEPGQERAEIPNIPTSNHLFLGTFIGREQRVNKPK
jgi:hypothetical protein